ncbi:MAG: hypothetical protein N2383_11990 [Caldilineales bacterium]|nr:hypothetical protein [Caldilineales bacterium]
MVTFFHRNLPHYHLPDATCFVTIRLAGRLPVAVAMRLQEEYKAELRGLAQQFGGDARRETRYGAQRRHFGRMDALLDQARHGPRWLARPECAAIAGVGYIVNNPVKARRVDD